MVKKSENGITIRLHTVQQTKENEETKRVSLIIQSFPIRKKIMPLKGVLGGNSQEGSEHSGLG